MNKELEKYIKYYEGDTFQLSKIKQYEKYKEVFDGIFDVIEDALIHYKNIKEILGGSTILFEQALFIEGYLIGGLREAIKRAQLNMR